ncbi:hypothetical protein ABZ791_22675 [Streptomyces huasconensis]|uniref:Uncharacterized protein n=1 Tax=Streptomyces huasconensis TaxID=1854574 RepID=A0ABV3LUB3_9ACTN
MHTYDPSRSRPAYQNPIPSMRTAQDATGERSATPIYDTLYSEYRRAFRALPGDRSGEEHLGFTAFGTGPYGTQQYGQFQHLSRYGRQDHHVPGHHHVPAALPPAPRREL